MPLRPDIILFEALTAETGLEISKNGKFDLILMDLNLPGISGQEAYVELQKNNNTVEASILSCKDLGFKDYITKPIKVDNFLHVIDTILEAS